MKFDPYLTSIRAPCRPFSTANLRHRRRARKKNPTSTVGHYERFTHAKLSRDNTGHRAHSSRSSQGTARRLSGQDRAGIPHVTNEIKDAMKKVARNVDRGHRRHRRTVGDIESLPFLEAIRQMRQEMVATTPCLSMSLCPMDRRRRRMKTKPTQHSVKELLSIGIQPDMLLCRTDRFLSKDLKGKDRAVLQR